MNWLRKSNWNRWAHQDCGRRRGLGAPELQSSSGKWPEENVPVFRLPPCASYKHLKLFLRWWKDKSKMFYFFIFKIFFSFLFIYSSLIQCILTISFPPSTPSSSLPPTSVMRVGKLILKSWNWENWHCPPSAVALGRAASTPRLDGTEELTLFEGSQVSWSRQHESRFDPTPLCLPCGGMGEEKCPTPLSLTSCGSWESWLRDNWSGCPDFAPQQLEHRGEETLNLVWTAH